MTKQKHSFRILCKFIKSEKLKYHTDISIQTLYFVHSWSTYGNDYSLESSWVWWGFSAIYLYRSSQALSGWMGTISAIFKSLHMFSWVQVRALAGPPRDIYRVVPKPILCWFGSVLRVISLMEGEPLVQSEVLSTLDLVFIKNICLDQSPCSCYWKTAHSMMLPPPYFIIGQLLGWFPPDMMLRTEAKQFNLGFIRESCFHKSKSPLGAFF